MRLLYSPAACSISAHIILEEVGQPFGTMRVLTKMGGTKTSDFTTINPKGKVPVLISDDESVLTETPVILQFLANMYPDCRLLPSDYRDALMALETCEYLSNTVHNFGLTRPFRPQLFCPIEAGWPEVRAEGLLVLKTAFELIGKRFEEQSLLCENFSIADASLFFFELHARRLGIAMPKLVRKHFELILGRSSVQAVIAREALDLGSVDEVSHP